MGLAVIEWFRLWAQHFNAVVIHSDCQRRWDPLGNSCRNEWSQCLMNQPTSEGIKAQMESISGFKLLCHRGLKPWAMTDVRLDG